ncbi:hypothetical protein [Butyrivibrio proteoclasticus]|uniref:hypothetical protein n=1 Tax=Butyrivibrio proteoclasticus TaxID=43305 RepID=UPI00047C24D2|nr:hypothetical protein [Butyrivibrio proteoclasticus]
MDIVKKILFVLKDIIVTVFGDLFESTVARMKCNAKYLFEKIKRRLPIAVGLVILGYVIDMIHDPGVFFSNISQYVLLFIPDVFAATFVLVFGKVILLALLAGVAVLFAPNPDDDRRSGFWG